MVLYRPAGSKVPANLIRLRPRRLHLQSPPMEHGYDYWPTPTTVAMVVAGLAMAYVWLRPDFIIRVRDGHCRCRGKLAVVVQRAFAQFMLDDLRPSGFVLITGKYRQRRLRLFFWGKLSPGQKQRIRNFLLTHR